MKKILMLLMLSFTLLPLAAKTVENEMYFRAMKDEMDRTLKELRLPGQLRPYYLGSWVREFHSSKIQASLGALVPNNLEDPTQALQILSLLKIGTDQNNNTGYFNSDRRWTYFGQQEAAHSYEAIRQALWQTFNSQYLEAIEQYEEKQAYRRKHHIKEDKPDVIAAQQEVYIEPILPWQSPKEQVLKDWVVKVSAWGRDVSFLEDFLVTTYQWQNDDYYLNTSGAKSQDCFRGYLVNVEAYFRQPDGETEDQTIVVDLKDFSAEELARAEQKIHSFLEELNGLYGAQEAVDPYLGPVLYKPTTAAKFFQQLFVDNLTNTVAWWNPSGSDFSASPFIGKVGQRIMSPGITIYDRPQQKEYQSISLANFSYLDGEGVPAQELLLVSQGRLQNLPLSQRPVSMKEPHASNGHGLRFSSADGSMRESLSNVFVEVEHPLTEAQLEEKLLARCKELGLEYGYIQDGLGFVRIYVADGRKERVRQLENKNSTIRSLRDIIGVGDDPELIDRKMVTPSLLVDEVDLDVVVSHPTRKPLVPKP